MYENTGPIIAFQRVHEHAQLPKKNSLQAVGYDLYACEDVIIAAGKTKLVPLGFKMELPAQVEAQIRPRSGLALRHSITVLNTPGTIDPDYRGEVGVILINHGHQNITLFKGERIAQMVFQNVLAEARICEVDKLEETDRGDGGFGSTGK